MRNVVIEHNVVSKETGEELPTLILDGAGWGEDFNELASDQAEQPLTYYQDEGFNNPTGHPVTFDQTFLRTEKSDEELLAIYETGLRRIIRRHMSVLLK